MGLELFEKVRKSITERYGRENHIERDITRYRDYRRDCFGRAPSTRKINIEEFLEFLDVEHFLRLKGKDTWSDEGNESQLMIRCAIAEVIHRYTPEHIHPAYRALARGLGKNAWVLTLNYDTVFERALALEGIPYRLFQDRYLNADAFGGEPDSRDEVVLLKLHGSIDWCSKKAFDDSVARVKANSSRYPRGYTVRNPVFGKHAIVKPLPLVEGPRPPGDALKSLYRIENIEPLLSTNFWEWNPYILPPSHTKLLYAEALKELWHGLQRIGSLETSFGIIGYSLPKYDEYARQLLYNISRNYFAGPRQPFPPGPHKREVRVIDFQQIPRRSDFQNKTYRFLGSKRAAFRFDGFNDASAKWLLR